MAHYATIHLNGAAVGIVAISATSYAAAGTPDFMDDYRDSIEGVTTKDPIERLKVVLHGYPYHTISGPHQYDGTAAACILDLKRSYGF